MQKLKSFNSSHTLAIIKACLLAIVITLIGVVILALILKFTDLSSNFIGYINDVIKALSIFVMVLFIKKWTEANLLIKSIIGGLLYAILSFVIFSILNGGFAFNMSFVYDLLFSLIASMIVAVIFNIIGRKNV